MTQHYTWLEQKSFGKLSRYSGRVYELSNLTSNINLASTTRSFFLNITEQKCARAGLNQKKNIIDIRRVI